VGAAEVSSALETRSDRLEAVDLECVRGDRNLFAGVGFSLGAGEFLHVAGANGSGKTTLLRMVCGLVQPVRGEVRWRGRPVGRLGEDYLKCITFLGHSNGIKDDLTCRENLLISTTFSGAQAAIHELETALETMGLSRYGSLPTRVLSQGQRRRLALARLLLSNTPLWVLDEPFNALDVAAVESVESAIATHVAEGGMVMLTSHQNVGIDARNAKRLEMG